MNKSLPTAFTDRSGTQPENCDSTCGHVTCFIVRLECRAWPYDYPPTDLLLEARDEDDARRQAIEYDKWAEILSIRPAKGDSNGRFGE